MKKTLGRWGQKAGESVGMVKRTTEVDEDYARQVAASDCRKDVQEKLVRHLTPDSMKGNLFSKKELSEEEKLGDFLLKSGATLATTNEDSAYSEALKTLGDMFNEIGQQHRLTDTSIDERTIQPMKQFLDTRMKDIAQLKKRSENCRLDYEREKRASEKKGETEVLQQAAKWYDESKEQYVSAMAALQDSEAEQIAQLEAYIEAQLQFHQKCVEALRDASSTLSRHSQTASSRPKHSPYLGSSSLGSTSSGSGGDHYSAPAAAPPQYGADPSAVPAYQPEPRRAVPTPPVRAVPAAPAGGARHCIAMYDFTGQAPGELTFHSGDQITFISQVNPEWGEGELWGKKGIFPLNYVQMG